MGQLKPDDILHKIPGVQVVNTEDGRLLISCARGTILRQPVPMSDLERVLKEVDGQQTVDQIVEKLGHDYIPEDIRSLLEALRGDLFCLNPAEEMPAPKNKSIQGKVLLGGPENLTNQFKDELASRGFTQVYIWDGEDEAVLDGTRLLVCFGDGKALKDMLDIQLLAFKHGVPTLFLTGEAGRIYVGPTVLPGRGPCLACARLTPFLGSGEDAGSILKTLGLLRCDLTHSERALEKALDFTLFHVLQIMNGASADFAHGYTFYKDSGKLRRHLTRLPQCPTCSHLELGACDRDIWKDLIAHGLDSECKVLTAFSEGRTIVDHQQDGPYGICILGGGTAGYLTALALRKKLPHIQVTLLQSSEIPSIGVGEATTPLMPQFLHGDLGIDVAELFKEVEPTLKLGIHFKWGGPDSVGFNYPFGMLRLLESAYYDGNLDQVNVSSMMMNMRKIPLYLHKGGGSSWLNLPQMAYHLDNARFSVFLAKKAREWGIQEVDCRVDEVIFHDCGKKIKALRGDDGQVHAFDFFVDCSGFRSLLMGEALGSFYEDFAPCLFTDRALVGKLPSEEVSRPYTTATALDAGWYWQIPQKGERHLGYVYSSEFSKRSQAEDLIRSLHPEIESFRQIEFRAGRRGHFLKGNVAALGNAYGFVEPLESTALHMLIRQIGLLVRSLPISTNSRGLQEMLNKQVNGWWDYLRWFLSIHYKFNGQLQTPFWRACRESVDVGAFEELLTIFRERGPLTLTSSVKDCFNYPDPLWGAEGIDVLLLGQGLETRLSKPQTSEKAYRRWCRDTQSLLKQLASQDIALDALKDNPDILKQLGRLFRSQGPAFGN